MRSCGSHDTSSRRSLSSPRVVIDAPAGWHAAEIAPPKISESAGAEIAQYAAFRSDAGGSLTLGCVATGIPGWVEEMRPAVEGRTVALAGASAAGAAGTPIDARDDGHGVFELRAANDLAGPIIGRARTFVGFDAGHVYTCFATCTRDALACTPAMQGARLEGTTAPPPPGLALGAVTWGVHHPRDVVAFAAVVITLAGVLAVALRRRPRHKAG